MAPKRALMATVRCEAEEVTWSAKREQHRGKLRADRIGNMVGPWLQLFDPTAASS